MLRLLTIVLVVASLVPTAFANSSVWKISRGNHAIYLGGTCHLLRPQDFPLPPEFAAAYAASSKIIFETDMSRLTSPEMQEVVASRGMFQDGTTLEKFVTPQTWKTLVAHCEKVGLPIDHAARMKPWLFTLVVSAIELQKLGMATEGVDIYYFKKASAERKSLGQLESFEQQIEFITQMGSGHESELIEKTLEDLDEIPRILGQILEAWKNGDMEVVDRVMMQEVRTDHPALFQSLVIGRNHAWLPKIEAMLKTNEVEFVLVGVGHIPGADGLLALLRGRGYEVEQVSLSSSLPQSGSKR